MKQIVHQSRKTSVLGIIIASCFALFALMGVNGEAAGKYMTKVTGTYTSSLSLLQLKVTVDMDKVGDVKAVINGKTYDNFKWSSTYYERAIAGVALNTDVKLTAYDFNGKVLETQTYTLDKSGKLVEKASTVPVAAVSMSLVLKAGSTASFEAMVSPTTATNKQVSWSSSNKGVATVDVNGNVKAVKAGTAVITATTKDGAKATSVNITVK